MALLGLLFMVVAVAAGVVVITTDTTATTTSITVMDTTVQLSATEVFLTGVAAAVVFVIGLAMMSGGLRRSLTLRRDLRHSRGEARRARRLEQEKRELERRLDDSKAPDTAGRHAAPDGSSAPAVPSQRPADPAPSQRPATSAAEESDRLVAGRRNRTDPTA
ncbi:hypothetical protein DP939_01715 [Spongiactinospora rosea]|uniref:Lipopolysaccharide assembly protein A domain-containing protein n=1 Tax=Spongiactinospora rosea TaxID=2248750 RepID=A0A366M5G5_9ACTN|nr:hypothetical protein [Spongiactinospora rosea]RBQ21456.1 hypothetical protein DP939_01715 [Spongiactinospora rosea]